MTKLNDEQVALLALIGQTRETERNVRSRVRADFDKIVAERQAPVHAQLVALVERAYGLGVPKRQIGLAMGTTATQSVTELLGGEKKPVEAVEEVLENALPLYVSITRSGDFATVTTTNGEAHFARLDDEWLAADDLPITLEIERSLFGANLDPELRAAFENAVSE